MDPRIVLRPIFWIRSSLLVCVLAAVAHALAPNSNVGLTAPVSCTALYTVLIILEFAPQCVPASFLIPFGATTGVTKAVVCAILSVGWCI